MADQSQKNQSQEKKENSSTTLPPIGSRMREYIEPFLAMGAVWEEKRGSIIIPSSQMFGNNIPPHMLKDNSEEQSGSTEKI